MKKRSEENSDNDLIVAARWGKRTHDSVCFLPKVEEGADEEEYRSIRGSSALATPIHGL